MAAIGKMEYAYDAASTFPIVHEYDIAAGTVIEKGEVVKLVEGLVVAVGDTDQDDPYLGVAEEDHTGVANILNPRSNGTRIKVYDSPTAVFKCKPNAVLTAASGSSTTAVDSAYGSIANDKFNGGYLVVISATNLLPGQRFRISDFATTSGTFTAAFGAAVAAGDKFLILPPVLSFGWDLVSDGTNLDLAANGGESLLIEDADANDEYVYWRFRLHQKASYMLAI
jgi:hypothetical protein